MTATVIVVGAAALFALGCGAAGWIVGTIISRTNRVIDAAITSATESGERALRQLVDDSDWQFPPPPAVLLETADGGSGWSVRA